MLLARPTLVHHRFGFSGMILVRGDAVNKEQILIEPESNNLARETPGSNWRQFGAVKAYTCLLTKVETTKTSIFLPCPRIQCGDPHTILNAKQGSCATDLLRT